MLDPADRRRLLTTARAGLLDGADPALRGVPRLVAASWQRSASSGVDPGELAHVHVPDLDLQSRLVRCARPVVERLADQLADVPVCVALTDDRARLLVRRDTTAWIGRVLDRVSFAQGFDYAETTVGTNGVGTVLASGGPVHIVGAEHFVEGLQAFACAGAPVRDPVTGRVTGVLDVSCLSRHSTPVLHSLVRTAAADLERALLQDRDRAQQALFDRYARVDARGREAVLAVGRRTVVANAAVGALLDPADLAALQDHVRFVMQRRATADDRVELPSGTLARWRGSTVRVGDEVAGMVGVVRVLADPVDPSGRDDVVVPAPRRPAAHPPGGPAGTPAWRAAAATVGAALGAGEPVLVLGEHGSGRTRLLRDLFGGLHPDGRVLLVEPGAIEPGAIEPGAIEPGAIEPGVVESGADDGLRGLARAVRAPHPGPTLAVLRDIDQLSPAAARALAGALAGRPAGTLLAATAAPGGAPDAPHAALLVAFRQSAAVPPLRHRTADLPALVQDLLAELAPHRCVRPDDGALRLLLRSPWPGNVEELRGALAAALAVRPVGTIRAEDLPATCSSAPRSSLRAVDRAERDAIVAALRSAGGNKVAAATQLGLARSTLYRKIRQYGLAG